MGMGVRRVRGSYLIKATLEDECKKGFGGSDMCWRESELLKVIMTAEGDSLARDVFWS